MEIDKTELYRLIFESSKDAVLLVENNRIIECNMRILELFGYEKDQLIGSPLDILLPEIQSDGQNAAKIIEELTVATPVTTLSGVQIQFKNANQNLLRAFVSIEKISLEKRAIFKVSIRKISEDTNPYRRAVRQLRYEQGLAACAKALLTDDANAMDSALDELLKASGTERVYVFENFTNTDKQLCAKEVAEATASGVNPIVTRLGTNHIIYQDTFPKWNISLARGTHISGPYDQSPAEERWFFEKIHSLSTLIIPIFRAGEWYGFIGFDTQYEIRDWKQIDITPLQNAAQLIGNYIANKNIQQDLKASEEMLRAVIDNLPHFIFWKNRDQAYLGANLNYLKALKLRNEKEILGKTDAQLGRRKDEATIYSSHDQQVMESDSPIFNYLEERTQDGKNIWYNTTKIPLHDEEGEVIGVLGMVTDVTEEKIISDKLQTLLEKREEQVKLSIEIGQEIAGAPELNELFRRVVTSVKERLGYYHAQIFVHEPAMNAVVLVAGYGEPGALLLANRHKLEMRRGVVGTALATQRSVLASDVTKDPDWIPNRFLPDTKGELAVPIKLKDEVLGILDIQSEQAGKLTSDDQILLEGLCSQIAVAIRDTRLRQELEENLNELQSLQKLVQRRGWQEFRKSRENQPPGYLYEHGSLQAIESESQSGHNDGNLEISPLETHISILGETYGHIRIENDPQVPITSEDENLLSAISVQVSQALDKARLLDQTQKQRAEVDTLNQMARELATTLKIDDLLQIAYDYTSVLLGEKDFFAAFYNEEIREVSFPFVREKGKALVVPSRKSGNSLTDHVIRTKEPLLIRDQPEKVIEELGLDKVIVGEPSKSWLGVPLAIGDRVIGVLGVQNLEMPNRFNERHQDLFVSIARQTTIALENARLFQESDILYRASEALNKADSYTEVLDVLRKFSILGLNDSAVVVLGYFDKPWTQEEIPTWINVLEMWAPIENPPFKERFPLATFPYLANNFQSDRPLTVGNIANAQMVDENSKTWSRRLGFKSVIFLPLVVGSIWRGYLAGFYLEEVHFSEEETRRLMALVGQAAVVVQGLQNLQLARQSAEQANQRSQELALVNKIVGMVAEAFDLQEGLRIICKELSQAIQADRAGIALLNETKTHLTVVSEYIKNPDEPSGIGIDIPIEGNPSTQEVFNTRQPVLIHNVQQNPDTQPLQADFQAFGTQNILILPLIANNEVIGTIGLDFYKAEREILDEQMRLAEAIIYQASTAIYNSRLYEQTQLALTEAETLYQASSALNAVENFGDILATLREHTALGNVGTQNITIYLFDQPWTETVQPEWLIPLTWWVKTESDKTVPSRFPLTHWKTIKGLLKRNQPTKIEYVEIDNRDKPPRLETCFDVLEATTAILIPLVVSGQWVGQIAAIFDRPIEIDDTQHRRLIAITQQAAVALQNIRLLQETQRRATQLQTGAEIARDTTGTLALEELLNRAVNLILERYGFYHASIFLVDENSNFAVVRESTGKAGAEMIQKGHQLEIGGQSIIGVVCYTGNFLVVNDVSKDPIHRYNPLLPKTQAEVGIPLKLGNQIIGALDVQSTEIDAFSTDDVNILQTLADQIAVAISNTRLYTEVRQRLDEQEWLYRITTSAAAALSLDEALQGTANEIRDAMRNSRVAILLLDDDEKRLVIQANAGYDPPPTKSFLHIGEGVIGTVAQTGQSILVSDVRKDDRYIEGSPQIRSELAVPLRMGAKTTGVINVENENLNEFTETDQRLLLTLANTLSAIISNTQLFEAEQRQRQAALTLANAAAKMSETLSESDLRQLLMDEISSFIQPSQISMYDWVADDEAFIISRRQNFSEEVIDNYIAGDFINPSEREDLWEIYTQAKPFQEIRKHNGDEVVYYFLPWRIGDTIFGVIEIIQLGKEQFFLPEEQILCEGLIDQAANALRISRLYEEQRETAEYLQELDKLKSQFLANMSHELRTPLNSIIGFSRVILKGIDGPISEMQEQDLNSIYNSGQHLLRLINDILDLSKIEAGKMEILFDDVDLGELISSVMSTGRGLIRDKPIQLIEEISPELPVVRGDNIRIRQTLLNLLSNAAKFTEKGKITVKAALGKQPSTQQPAVIISVMDTGIGIAKEDQGKLFEAFSQVDSSATRQAGGTGLGLAISRYLVELHGGEIWVDSNVGEGAVFSFSLPLPPVDLVDDKRKIILAVDDNQGVLTLYRRYLESEDFRIIELTNSDLTIETARQIQPFVILLDIFMPQKNGWDIIEELKENHETRDIPIIVCSLSTEIERAKSLGVNNFLSKPILAEDLITALKKLGAPEI